MKELLVRDQRPAAPSELSSIQDFIRWGASQFNEAGLHFGHGTDNALDEAAWLVLYALSMPADLPEAYYHSRLTGIEKEAVMRLLVERIQSRKPAAYLTGEAWFCGLSFKINESVLVPRSPIAELIQESFSPWLDGVEVARVLDLCTGSGCIGIACAHAFPDAQVDLSDISSDAVDVAKENIHQHDMQNRVTAIESDLFAQIPANTYELIVTNPPYVDTQEMEALPAEYQQEPVLGLAAGEDGLDIVRRILTGAGGYLAPDGLLVVEVGNSYLAVEKAWPEVSFTWLDFKNGGHGVFLLTATELQSNFS
ncbi:MAG: 50S ribosomal protein L3 N(5)-glutamine methyltransferase [Thiothrix sp.]|nr:MAG: 50S ribosomal protein L3 N(5)-glutamine methyltransferase [Thiothrix sp.]